MDHFSELTYSTYADGELPEPERLRVQQHLTQCPACRAQVAALEAENRILAEVFQLTAESEGARSRLGIGRSLLITVGSALAVALGLDRLFVAIEHFVPDAGSWLSGFSFAWLQSLVFNNAFDLIREGPVMLNALVTVLGLLVLGAVLFSVLRHFISRHPMSMALLATFLLALILPGSASAIERRQATKVRVPSGETVQESLIAQGDVVEIDGTVDGSLVVTARLAEIRGDIKGNVFFLGQEIQILGTVEGTVYAWTNTLTISGHVNQDVLVFANNVRLEGSVGRDVSSFSGTLDDTGAVGRNLQAYAGSLTVSKSARIGGNLEAHVKHQQDVNIENGTVISGKTQISLETKKSNRYATTHFYCWQAIWFAGALIIGFLLYLVAPVFFSARLDSGGALLRSAGVGFLAVVAAPVAAVVAFITLVGIPLGVLLLGLWLAGLWIAKVFVGAALGRGLMRPRPGESPNFAVPFIVGLLIIFVAINLPYVGGWLAYFIVPLTGVGLAVLGVRNSMRKGGATI